jgi:hypothetical protein
MHGSFRAGSIRCVTNINFGRNSHDYFISDGNSLHEFFYEQCLYKIQRASSKTATGHSWAIVTGQPFGGRIADYGGCTHHWRACVSSSQKSFQNQPQGTERPRGAANHYPVKFVFVLSSFGDSDAETAPGR